MAYEERYRRRVMEYLKEGHSYRQAQEVFKVGIATMVEWKKRLVETGSLARKPLNRRFKKIDPEKLEAYVNEHPDAYLREMAEVFHCSVNSVNKALKKLQITRKKN